MIIILFLKRLFPVFLLLAFPAFNAFAQTQDDFNNKLTDIYVKAADKKKVMNIAKEMYNMLEKKKDLQTYSNYYLLKTIFETQAPDATPGKELR